MMSEVQPMESGVLRNLRQVSEARGLKFYVNPPDEIVPGFLGGFRPYAIAVGPDGGIIIEVTHRKNSGSEKQLAAVAKKISGQKGWEFRAIYLNPSMDDTPSIAKPTPEQLRATFREIEALTKGGHPAAALVAGWAALESLARLVTANSEARRLIRFSPIQAVQTLAEEGYIENEDADRLREMAKLRDAVVHGDFSLDVPVEQVEGLLRQLQAIASDIMTDMREVQASEAKTHLPQLLDDVGQGETILITRHGQPTARLVPEADRRQAEINQAVTNIRAMRQGKTNKLTLDEILTSRHEGHEH